MGKPSVYGIVYRITCTVNGKQYHGQTVNPGERFPHHFRPDSQCHALRNAIRKYGRSNFVFSILAEAGNKEELDTLEKQWVSTSMSPVGYNLKEGGGNGRPSAEARQRMSVAQKEAQNRPEVKAKNSAGVKRAMARPDVKERHRKALKAALQRPEEKAKRSRIQKRVHARPGEKEKRSRAIQKSWESYTPKERKLRVAKQKAAITHETRALMGRKSRESQARPEVKERHRLGLQRAMTPERRKAVSAQMKRVHARPGEKEKRGAAISKAHNTPEGKVKLSNRRRRGETWREWSSRTGLPIPKDRA